MTLTDIILRDMTINKREAAREAAYKSLADYERAITRRLWTRRLKAFGEAFGAVLFFAGLFLFCYLCCACSGYNWQ